MTPIEVILAIIGSGTFGALVTAWLNRRKTAVEANHIAAETSHEAVDTAGDALKQYKELADTRYAAVMQIVQELTAKVKELEFYRVEDNKTIVKLNQLLGQVMRGAEEQGRQMNVMRTHIDELLDILRAHSIAVPNWAEAKP
jgi:mevalonate kinase